MAVSRTRAVLLALAAVAALASGCLAQSDASTATPEPTEEPVFRPVSEAVVEATPPPPLTEGEIGQVLRELVCWHDNPTLALTCLPPGEEFLTTLQRVALSEEERFIAPLIDMLWLDLGWERWVREALERISGERFASAGEWYAWMAENPPELPEGYAEWKGRLLAVIDPGIREALPEGTTGDGPGPEHLVWSLVGRDGVPPLVSPATVHQAEERYLGGGDVVYGVVIGGEARAYPERIIGWHGTVTDEVAGTGVLVWHCAVCGGAAVFNRFASDGNAYTFSAAGLVWESRRLFTDEETGSLWDAVSGRAVAGPLAEAGVSLTPRPSVRSTWGEWSARYPNGRVLSLDTGFVRDYAEGASLRADAEPDAPAFPVSRIDGRLDQKQRVLGVSVNGARKAYPLDELERRQFFLDNVGGVGIVIISSGPGRGATVYETAGTGFEGWSGPPEDRVMSDDENLLWFIDDERLLNTRNSRVRNALPSQVAYWFAWSGAFPDAVLWTP